MAVISFGMGKGTDQEQGKPCNLDVLKGKGKSPFHLSHTLGLSPSLQSLSWEMEVGKWGQDLPGWISGPLLETGITR